VIEKRSLQAGTIAIGVGLLGWTVGVGTPAPETLGAACRAALVMAAILLGAAWTVALLYPGPVAGTLKVSRTPRPLSARQFALGLMAFLALSHVLGRLLSAPGTRPYGRASQLEALLADASGTALVGAAFALAVAPAVAEETLFRGLLLGRLCERWGVPTGLLGSSALFAAMHPGWAEAAATGVLGLCLGAITLRTGSLYAGLLFHATNNLVFIYAVSPAP